MSSEELTPEKLFTLAEANRMLPLVRRIVEDIRDVYRRLVEKAARYRQICPEETRGLDAAHIEELESMRADLEREQEELTQYVEELGNLGVFLKGEEEGLVDFPSLRDGRIVFLCWKLGEPEIRFWHETDEGFAGRQPLERSQLAKASD